MENDFYNTNNEIISNGKIIISTEGIPLVDLYKNIILYTFIIDEDDFIDFDSYYMIKLFNK